MTPKAHMTPTNKTSDSRLKIAEELFGSFRCPVCKDKMEVRAVSIHCLNADCALAFPIVDGIPVLINEISSVFRIEDFTDHRSTTLPPPSKLKKFAKKFMPGIHRNVTGQANYAKFANLVSRKDGRPRVLVIGGSDDGE